MKNLVSIIIPSYNRSHLIGETLDSVIAQTYVNWECIIIDDKSTDETFTILSTYLKKDNRFIYVSKPSDIKKGASGSRNLGLKLAKGEYIQFLDSDDLLAENKLEEQLKLLITESKYTISTCKWGFFDIIGKPYTIFENKADYKNFENPKKYFDLIGQYGGFFPLHVFLINKELINSIGGWNENLTMCDDGEFFFRVLLNSDKIVYSDRTYVLYRNSNDDNLSSLNSKTKAISLVNSWKIIEALYTAKYNEINSMYLGKKKESVYYELKKHFPKIISNNRFFFKHQIEKDTFFLKIKKLNKRIIHRLKIIFK